MPFARLAALLLILGAGALVIAGAVVAHERLPVIVAILFFVVAIMMFRKVR